MKLSEDMVQQLVNCLEWYVETDEVHEGGDWEEENAYWLEAKRLLDEIRGK